MKVERYIYTRLSAAQSPKRTTGFQSAFMPAGLHKHLHAVSLESHIHLPTVNGILEKRTVFFVEADRTHWQVIMFIRSLPLERDEFGRGGIFLAQGFLIPPQIWQRFANPLRLSAALEQLTFNSIEQILADPQVDKEKGLISPIDLGVLPEADILQNDLELSDPERKSLILLCKILSGNATGLSLVYHGPPRQAEQLFSKWAGFLPSVLKCNLAWDSSFDGGKLFFAPHNCVAFTEAEPVTGKQAILDPRQGRLRYSEPDIEDETKPFDAYTRWLEGCQEQDLDPNQIEAHWNFSESITQGTAFQGPAPSPCFCRQNVQFIRKWLAEGTDPLLPKPWRQVLGKTLKDEDIIQIASSGFPDKLLAAGIARAILEKGLYPGNFKHSPPLVLSEAGEPKFNALLTMWSGNPINPNWLLDIVIEDRERILCLFAQNGMEREAATKIGFTDAEIQQADRHFHGTFQKLWKRLIG